LGPTGTSGSVVAPSSTAASGAVPSTGTAYGITDPSTCASIITTYTPLVPGGYDYYLRQTASSRCTYPPLR
jgi:hypothetical protein